MVDIARSLLGSLQSQTKKGSKFLQESILIAFDFVWKVLLINIDKPAHQLGKLAQISHRVLSDHSQF